NNVYENATVDKYVIMPNHIHMIITIHGTMKASSPTINTENIIRSFKTMVTKELGNSIFQRSFHDHIIRNDEDYKKVSEYIGTNVLRWESDCFYK
ncbi:MAG: transposase, partial [Lachnospiraceae bacterium]|nr:transposase [Lachnospiraceae bacterium]